MKGVKNKNLPTKICVVCNKPFTWRKKWEKVWDEVNIAVINAEVTNNMANKTLRLILGIN
jgi:hypothetical protein